MSGLLIGILGSRGVSGLVGERFGWQMMYYTAAVLMVLLFLCLEIFWVDGRIGLGHFAIDNHCNSSFHS